LIAWIVALMLVLEPASPWLGTFRGTALAVDRACHAAPLYPGEDGPARCAAELIAIGWYESRFEPDALAHDGSGTVCLGQVDARGLMASADAIRTDIDVCIHAMLERARESHRVCALRGRGPLERLGQYTGGGGACDRGLAESRRRAALADALVRRHPVRWIEE